MKSTRKKILFIDGSDGSQGSMERVFIEEQLPYDLLLAASAREALEIIPANSIDLIVAEFHSEEIALLDALRAARSVPVIILVYSTDLDLALKMVGTAVCDFLVKDDNGKFLRLLSHKIALVLKQHEAFAEGRRLQEQYQVLSDASPLGIFRTDASGKCTYTNQRYLELTGLTLADAEGEGWVAAVHEEDRSRVYSEWQQAIQSESPYSSTHRFVRPDGQTSWCSINASAVYRDGVLDGYVGTVEDITAQKISEQRLTLATSAAQIGIWEWDIQADKLIWDASMFVIYGIRSDQFSGASEAWRSAVHPADLLACEQTLHLALQGVKDAHNFIYRIRRPDGCIRFIQNSATVERNGDGQPIRMVGTNLDVTELKATEESLRTILLETAQKTRLLDFISHIQGKFIGNTEPAGVYESILMGLLDLTESSYGFIGKIVRPSGGKPYLKIYALTNKQWDDESSSYFKQYYKDGCEFHDLDTLYGSVITTEKVVIANDQANDRRGAILPPGHSELTAFAGLPLFFEGSLVGMIGVANRPGGYSDEFIKSLQPVLASCGNLISAFGMIRAKKLADTELEEYRDRLELTFKAGNIGSCDWNVRTGEMNFDSSWAEMLGYQVDELRGSFEQWLSHLHPDDLQQAMQALEDHLHGKTDFCETEYRVKAKDGSWTWVLYRRRVISRDADEKPLRVPGTHFDITARKRRDEELAYQQALLSVFVENVPAAIAMFNTEMIYISVSKAWSQAYRLGDQQILGRSHYEVFNNISEEWRAVHQRALAGEVIRCKKDVWRPPGWKQDQTLRWEVRPWYLSSGKIGGIIVMSQDITEQCEKEDELIRMRIAAEAATLAKGQFLAHMSHEIRTPLTSIIGFAEAAREDGVTALERIQALNTILLNGKHMLGIINDILDFSKLDVGALEVDRRPVSIVKLVDDIRVLMVPRLAEKGLSLIVTYEWPLPEKISVDGVRLMQILVNLTSNAVKFTHRGRVEIKVWCSRSEKKAHFSVTDTGIGLSKEEISRIFQPFVQADVGTSRKFGGTGLGLSISKQLVDRLGGEISVTSEVDVGSTFAFSVDTGDLDNVKWITRMPMENTDSLQHNRSERSLAGRVLIADDAADNRNLLQFILRKTHLDITFVENGKEALDAVLEKHFDIVLLDMQMPVMDGYTAAREMRARGVKIPIIALTANAMKQDVLRCIEAGCTIHFPKPFGREALLDCLHQQLLASRTVNTKGDAVLSEMFKEDPESLGIVLDFVDGIQSRIEKISGSLDEQDYGTLKDAAHRLSGSAGLFGYGRLCEHAANLELAAQGRNLEDAASLKSLIEKEHCAILKGVEEMKHWQAVSPEHDDASTDTTANG